MGEPSDERKDTAMHTPAGDEAERTGQDGLCLSTSRQSPSQPDNGAESNEATEEEPKTPLEEDGQNFAEEVSTRFPAVESAKKGVEEQTFGGSNNGSGASGVSVTVLTLDAVLEERPRSRQQFLHTPRSVRSVGDRDGDMSDLKLIRDFQVRRKYGRRPGQVPPQANIGNKSFLDLGLSGTRYFARGNSDNSKDNNHNNSTNNNSNGSTPTPQGSGSRTRKLPNALPATILEDPLAHLQNGSTTPASSTLTKTKTADEDRTSMDSAAKDLQSPVPSFPPLSPGPRSGVRSENSFYSARYSGQSPSLLINHFGFSTIRPDTFSGIQRRRRLKMAEANNDDLLRELEQHAQRQILACQNMGYTHRGSRAAESVLSLKSTVSPSAFHPPSFFTKHMPREERGSRSGTPRGMGGEGEESTKRRRVPHPAPVAKLSMPRLVMTDRQDQAARKASLPTVSGSSLQVVLAQSHSK